MDSKTLDVSTAIVTVTLIGYILIMWHSDPNWRKQGGFLSTEGFVLLVLLAFITVAVVAGYLVV